MRECQDCKEQDRPWMDGGECTCGAARTEMGASPEAHHVECRCLAHEVVQYPVRLSREALTWDKKLPRYWALKGWVLMENGGRHYRLKMLCRDCVGKEELALAHRRDYERVCKEARGGETQTYAQMLAQQ
jgi:hypothetical protein